VIQRVLRSPFNWRSPYRIDQQTWVKVSLDCTALMVYRESRTANAQMMYTLWAELSLNSARRLGVIRQLTRRRQGRWGECLAGQQ
jgi:hypothetical protein